MQSSNYERRSSERAPFSALRVLNVDGAQLAAVLRIGLGLIRDLLALRQGLVALGNDRRKMDEYVLPAVVVGNKTIALFRVEPLDSTFVHDRCPPKKTFIPRAKKILTYFPAIQTSND